MSLLNGLRLYSSRRMNTEKKFMKIGASVAQIFLDIAD